MACFPGERNAVHHEQGVVHQLSPRQWSVGGAAQLSLHLHVRQVPQLSRPPLVAAQPDGYGHRPLCRHPQATPLPRYHEEKQGKGPGHL